VIDVQKVSDLGYDVVVRPTGGRALLHKGDLCYAVASKRDWHPEFSSLGRSYRAISAALSEALMQLGVALPEAAVAVERERRDFNPCFAKMSPFEIQVAGRKICGSAQFRTGDYFLQHGSIRVRDNWNSDDLNSLWPAGFGLKADRITSIDRELGSELDFAELESALVRAFATTFSVDIRNLNSHPRGRVTGFSLM
jgi:lipoate-protein ligase A